VDITTKNENEISMEQISEQKGELTQTVPQDDHSEEEGCEEESVYSEDEIQQALEGPSYCDDSAHLSVQKVLHQTEAPKKIE
jgi:hypothetical protein